MKKITKEKFKEIIAFRNAILMLSESKSVLLNCETEYVFANKLITKSVFDFEIKTAFKVEKIKENFYKYLEYFLGKDYFTKNNFCKKIEFYDVSKYIISEEKTFLEYTLKKEEDDFVIIKENSSIFRSKKYEEMLNFLIKNHAENKEFLKFPSKKYKPMSNKKFVMVYASLLAIYFFLVGVLFVNDPVNVMVVMGIIAGIMIGIIGYEMYHMEDK